MLIKRVSLLVASLAMLVAGCGESSLPNPTGKGSVRAINAVPGSPAVAFKIEQRVLGTIDYKDATTVAPYDDFSYAFSFEVLYAGDTAPTRIARVNQQIVPDRDFLFVLTGTVNNASITVWEGDEKNWEGTETDFSVRFAHLAETFGPVDIYLADETTAPALGGEAASLSFLSINDPVELPEGDYVVTVTSPGDPADVLFRSETTTLSQRTTLIITIFDGDENDLHPLAVRALRLGGTALAISEENAPAEVRFIQMSRDLPLADVYNDEALTSLVYEDLAFGDVTPDLPNPIGSNTITFTPANDIGSTLLDRTFTAVPGTRVNFYSMGPSGDYRSVIQIADRRSVATEARLNMLQTASNHDDVDLYVVDAGTSIDEVNPSREAIVYAAPSGFLGLAAGEYDVYVTPFAEKTVLAGPVRINVALGDVIESVLIDTVDPATAEFRIIPTQ